MSGRRFDILTRASIFFTALFFCVSPLHPQASTVVQPNTSRSVRDCGANPVLASSANKKKPAHKPKIPLATEPVPTCIEAKGHAIEIQEFLQNQAREQAWRIGENRASEDTWSYVRYLSAEELERFADTKVLIEPVEFANGKAAVIVRTSDLVDGYVRVQISAHFQGEGRSTDKISPQPATLWPLNSKGALEQDLVKALQSGYKPLE
jgi:hypothetical protein